MSIGADDILARCSELGFALAGVCAARPSDFQQEFHRWIDRGAALDGVEKGDREETS